MPDTWSVSQIVQCVTEGFGAFFCLIAVIVIWQTRKIDKIKVYGLLRFIAADGVLLLSDMFATRFRGQPGTGVFYMVWISYLLVYLTGYLVFVFGIAYFGTMIEKRVNVSIRNWKIMEYVFSGLGAGSIIVNQFIPFLYRIDENNTLRPLAWNWMIYFTYMMGVMLVMVLLLNFFRDLTGLERFAIISGLVFPMVAIIFRYFDSRFSLVAMSTFATVIFTFVSYMIDYTAVIAARERDREKWIAEENIRLLHNQIKPHFIYNALTGVYYGMDEDPARSKKAIKDLTGYLRGSLDVLDERESVDFAQELNTVACYLEVESFRFEDQIHVDIDAGDTDFKVPAFCIQTLVENAVRHGIRAKNPPEGTVSIHTRREDGAHVVVIEDDGVGFDIDEAMADEGVHIGLKNTQKRLDLMCAGTMAVESRPGAGTRITIRIPEQ